MISLKIVGGRVAGVLSSEDFHPASTVLLATGTDLGALCEPLGITLPVGSSPAFIMRAASPAGLVRTILATPAFEAREVRTGHLVLTAPHQEGLSDVALQRLAHRTLERAQSTFGGADPFRLLGHRVGSRLMPENGPILGYVTPDRALYVAVMHSAVTLAPTVGRRVAEEIVTGEIVAEL